MKKKIEFTEKELQKNFDNMVAEFGNDPVTVVVMPYQHIYHTNGFALSAEVSGDGKLHRPESIHRCMEHGDWCWDQLKEKPSSFIAYPMHYVYRVISSIQKYVKAIATQTGTSQSGNEE